MLFLVLDSSEISESAFDSSSSSDSPLLSFLDAFFSRPCVNVLLSTPGVYEMRNVA